MNTGPFNPRRNIMKIIICAHDGSYAVEGKDFASIALLLSLPPWAVTAHQAWTRNGWMDDFTLHISEGYTVMATAPVPEVIKPEPPAPSPSEQEISEAFHKASLYSDYHKDFYGTRPRYDGASACELAARFDAIRAKHMAMEATPEGRAQLRANGWELPPEPEHPVAKKAPAKKVARKAPAKKAARRKA